MASTSLGMILGLVTVAGVVVLSLLEVSVCALT